MLLGNIKKQTTDIYNNKVESQKRFTKWKKPDTKTANFISMST